MTKHYTIKDFQKDEVFIRNEDYEREIQKLKDTALSIKEELMNQKKERVKDNILIEKLKIALKETATKLHELTREQPQQIKIRQTTSLFNDVNKLLVRELEISPQELKKMEMDADKIIRTLIN